MVGLFGLHVLAVDTSVGHGAFVTSGLFDVEPSQSPTSSPDSAWRSPNLPACLALSWRCRLPTWVLATTTNQLPAASWYWSPSGHCSFLPRSRAASSGRTGSARLVQGRTSRRRRGPVSRLAPAGSRCDQDVERDHARQCRSIDVGPYLRSLKPVNAGPLTLSVLFRRPCADTGDPQGRYFTSGRPEPPRPARPLPRWPRHQAGRAPSDVPGSAGPHLSPKDRTPMLRQTADRDVGSRQCLSCCPQRC